MKLSERLKYSLSGRTDLLLKLRGIIFKSFLKIRTIIIKPPFRNKIRTWMKR